MDALKRVGTFMTSRSDRPLRRLIAYYAILGAVTAVILYMFPQTGQLLSGGRLSAASEALRLLQDGVGGAQAVAPTAPVASLLELALTTTVALIGTLALMLPVTWLYMSTRATTGHDQSVVQTLIILPIVVTGIVLIISNSLALAFSLAGVVAGVRFRSRSSDAGDLVFIFLAIAVGFAAGVHSLALGALVSIIFNGIVLLTRQHNFGGNLLQPTAATPSLTPLTALASANGNGNGHGHGHGHGHGRQRARDLVLALTPTKATALADRFMRLREVLGKDSKKPRFNAVLSVTTTRVGDAQVMVEEVLDMQTKRWKLDEIVTNTGTPSDIFYLVRLRKSVARDVLITAIRSRAGDLIVAAQVELSESFAKAQTEKDETAEKTE